MIARPTPAGSAGWRAVSPRVAQGRRDSTRELRFYQHDRLHHSTGHDQADELREACTRLNEIHRDPGPMVPVLLPWADLASRDQGLDARQPNWRRTAAKMIFSEAVNDPGLPTAASFVGCDNAPASVVDLIQQRMDAERAFRTLHRGRVSVPEAGPPLTAAGQPASTALTNIAGIPILKLMDFTEGCWHLPLRWADALDIWQSNRTTLTKDAGVCTVCGRSEPRSQWRWRQATSTGYETICPPCAHATFPPYDGSLDGQQYKGAQGRRTRPDAYLCSVCGDSRATVWDHCHDHGLVRGPLCAGCNVSEGQGRLVRPGARPPVNAAAVNHLLRCTGCAQDGGVPARHLPHLAASRHARSRRPWKHRRCSAIPLVRAETTAAGTIRIMYYCFGHRPRRRRDHHMRWVRELTPAAARRMIMREQANEASRLMSPPMPASRGPFCWILERGRRVADWWRARPRRWSAA